MPTNVIAEHIELRPSALHGQKPCIAGSRIRVQDIYIWHVVQGKSPEQIVSEFFQLTMADVYAAVAYYWDHRDTLDHEWAEAEEYIRQMKAEASPSPLRQRMREMGLDPDSLPT